MATGIQIKGLDKFIDKMEDLATETRDDMQTALNAFGERVVQDAKQLVASNSSDEGHLLGSIGYSKGSNLSVEIVAATVYAAYIEFGTRRYAAQYVATLPQDWQSYASTFRGKTGNGTFDQFIQAIMAWVQRKGIGGLRTKSGNVSGSRDSLSAMQSAAYAIALNILQNGIRPKPFLYPSIYEGRRNLDLLMEDLKAITDK